MLREILVDLDAGTAEPVPADEAGPFGKALAIRRMLEAVDPERTVCLSGYTPLTASGLGFAGKLNVYGISLLGGNLQGSRAGGLAAKYLSRAGVVAIRIVGDSRAPVVLCIDGDAAPRLVPFSEYGAQVEGTFRFAEQIYARHGPNVALALTDPATTGFRYNAIACNSRPGELPHRAAARGTTRFGRNGLVGIVVEHAPQPRHGSTFDRQAVTEIVRRIHAAKANANLAGSADPADPLLGGTYGAAAKARLESGHGLTDLFRSARVPDDVYESLLPENLVREQLRRSEQSGIRITRTPCMPGCPNKCNQFVLVTGDGEDYRAVKSGEWETYHGVLNLGLFEDPVGTAAEIIAHSNEHAYDHIEGLVTVAALALVTETQRDTGVRYGDKASVLWALNEAVEGRTDLGKLVQAGAAAVEQHYGLPRHFTVGGHALPFHNPRSLVQTGVGLSWTYGRHGECCAGPGRLNFLGDPYDPADHTLSPATHVLNAVHGMVLYGALDEMGMCFFMGPSVDTLVDTAMILGAMGLEAEPRAMVRDAARTIQAVHAFNAARGVHIQPLPEVFYGQATYGHAQIPDQAVTFDVPFNVVRDEGTRVLDDVASGAATIPDAVLATSRARSGD